MIENTNDNFGMWAIVELMGHVKLAGFVTEEELFGGKIGRIDIPTEEGKGITQYFGGHTVYRITPVSEETARMYAARNQPRPVYVYELKQLPAPGYRDDYDDDDYDDDDYDDAYDSDKSNEV